MDEKEKDAAVELTDEQLDQINGGSALDGVPTVDEHNYDDDVREKIK